MAAASLAPTQLPPISRVCLQLAKFPPPVYSALLREYTVRFGAEPATGEELPTFARQLLAELHDAVSSASKSALAKFGTKEDAVEGQKSARAAPGTFRGKATAYGGKRVLKGSYKGALGGSSVKSTGDSFSMRGGAAHAEVPKYFGDADELTDQAALETSFSFKASTRRRGASALEIEGDAKAKLALVDWVVLCPFSVAAALTAALLLFTLVASLPWALGDPLAQMSDPANILISDNLTQGEVAVDLAREYAVENGLARKLAVEVAARQGVAWHSLHLLYHFSIYARDIVLFLLH